MISIDIPTLGTLVLCGALVSAAYTFAVSLAAGRDRPRLLPAARYGTFATIALVATAVFLLAYAFQAHDFRIRYVARYSDRSMPIWYLWTALWGGQDGSILWWAFLLSGYTAAFVVWLRGKYVQMQPYMLATLMSILMFFLVVMLFAANPFATTFGPAPPDGEGLNPLLQNYWMMIHPPALYMGLVGWSIPFSIVVAALITGRLSDEWIHAARRWVLVAWAFLSLGNMLGMFWSYEELGWGGYWAWDPVENASFMPWLMGTAYLHSVMIQERRGMLKVWNVFLLCSAFILTIFGTFLTRSGMIASVHSFARSDIGVYFAWYLLFLVIVVFGLIGFRLPKLRVQARLDSLMSREFAFTLNNWILLAMLFFVMVATTMPLISEGLFDETMTIGPPVYNKWMVPFGLILLFLTGVGPLISWRKATGNKIWQAFRGPAAFGLLVMILHIAVGPLLGFPAAVESEEIYETTQGVILAKLYSISPVACTTLASFVLGTVIQEYWRGVRVRMKNLGENPATALIRLIAKAKRRYGGYLVHTGVVLMFLGFTGSAYDIEREASLRPGESMEVGGYTFRYERTRSEVDTNKRAIFTDLSILHDGERIGTVSPAKFIYRTHPEMPTTEVAIRSTVAHDLYVIMSSVDPQTHRGTFRVIKRPLVQWIWIGGALLLLGTMISGFPSLKELLGAREGTTAPGERAAVAVAILLALGAGAAGLLWSSGASAQSESSSSLHAGTVEIHDPTERQLFERLLCQCGDCQRLPLSTCACGWAEDARAELRGQLARGRTVPEIQAAYRARHGTAAIAIPPDQGLGRALWAVPVAALVLAGGGLYFAARRWVKRDRERAVEEGEEEGGAEGGSDAYDDRLEEELARLEEP